MQNKRPLLQRLLVIYVAFFIVLAVSIAHSLLPNFTKGFGQGTELGKEIAAEWMQGNPCAFYLLSDVAVHAPVPLGEADSTATGRRPQAASSCWWSRRRRAPRPWAWPSGRSAARRGSMR